MSKLTLIVDEFINSPWYPITRENGAIEMVPTMSLLERLEESKTRGLKSSGGSAGGMKIPVNASAHDIEADMIRTIHQTASPHDRYALACVGLGERLQLWSGLVEESLALAWCDYWKAAILSLDASSLHPVGSCPECGAEEFLEQREDGTIRKDPLICTVTPSATGSLVSARCQVCGAEWNGIDEVMELSSKL